MNAVDMSIEELREVMDRYFVEKKFICIADNSLYFPCVPDEIQCDECIFSEKDENIQGVCNINESLDKLKEIYPEEFI